MIQINDYQYLDVEHNQIIVLGDPDEGDDHNCDQMGCSSVFHVMKVVDTTHGDDARL